MSETPGTPPSTDEATKPVVASTDADEQAWQAEQTRQAVAEADAGEFCTAEELKTTVSRFVPNG